MPDPELSALVRSHTREVPDFPTAGVLFRDLTALFADGPAFGRLVDLLADDVRDDLHGDGGAPAAVGGVEARGFLLAAALAHRLGAGVVPIRKAGKLPPPTVRRSYALEYAEATIELPTGVVDPGTRVVLVDDVLATGGTLTAAADLLRDVGAVPVGARILIELTALGGAAVLAAHGLPHRAAVVH